MSNVSSSRQMTTSVASSLAMLLSMGMARSVAGDCSGIFPLTIEGSTCDKAAMMAAGMTEACLDQIFGAENKDAGVQATCSSLEIPFGKLSHQHENFQFDNNYMDGGTEWNDMMETGPETKIEAMAGRILRVKANMAGKARFAWPKYMAVNDELELLEGEYDPTGYMDNFHLENSCKLRAAMCCFAASRAAEGAEANPDNADVCYHDIRNSYKSAHIRRGWEVFPLDETSTTCVGFAWGADETSVSAMYKANALFQTSFVNTVENKYVKGIPGAPMCACIEQMPIVTHADCVDVKKAEGATASITVTLAEGVDAEGTVTYDLNAYDSTPITYGNCGGKSLKEHYATLSTAAEQKTMNKHIVAECDTATRKYFNSKFLKRVPGGETVSKTQLDGWTTVVGERTLYYPQIGETAFRALINQKDAQGRYALIWRQCDSCWDGSHRNIYYRRIAEWCEPSSMDALDLFMNNWVSECNTLNTHFKMYSSLEDAEADTNAWEFCNYDDTGVGFPRDCGPTKAVTYQWNSYDPRRNYGGAQYHVFRVQNVAAAAPAA